MVKPFLKWAGGKTKILDELVQRMPAKYTQYYEPFLGGGALFFHCGPGNAVLSDINAELIGTYLALRDDLSGVIEVLSSDAFDGSEECYYKVRAQEPLNLPALAARFIYLNKMCFNGLYRVNKKGEFNASYGKRPNTVYCDVERLSECSCALQSAALTTESIFNIKGLEWRSLVFLDPPYHETFDQCSAGGFRTEHQVKLARYVDDLDKRGIYIMLTNADTPLIRELYREYHIDRVLVGRSINRDSAGRGKVGELIIRNY